jgi:selenocysteine lyase/cysteine desulfurase
MSILYSSPAGFAAVQSLGHYFNPSHTLEYKLGLAGSSYELVASLPSVLAYFGPNPSASWAAIEKHEGELQSTLLSYLSSRPGITILGEKSADTEKRVSTISFVVEGRKSRDFVERVDELTKGDIGIRWGGFYSNRLIEEVLGLTLPDGIVRVSMVHYNTCKSSESSISLLPQMQGSRTLG